VHEEAFADALYVLAPHAAQVRSVVAVPAVATYVPAAHVLFAVHAVAGSASSSQVAPPHATAAAEPPAQ